MREAYLTALRDENSYDCGWKDVERMIGEKDKRCIDTIEKMTRK